MPCAGRAAEPPGRHDRFIPELASAHCFASLALDPDGDGLTSAFEATIGSDPTNTDSDGDGCPDAREISSLDTNTIVNSVDLLLIALRLGRTDQPVQDVNKDGIINVIDLATAARNFNSNPCP